MSAHLEARREAFLSQFLLPLLEGGEVQVGRVLQQKELEYFSAAPTLNDEVESRIVHAFRLHAGALTLRHAAFWPSPDLLALGCAIHNYVLATDPVWTQGRSASRDAIQAWAAHLLVQAGLPETRTGALMRHVLVGRTLELRRRDIHAVSWVHRYRYLGRPMPTGFWNRPRMVEIERMSPRIQELWGDDGSIAKLKAVSPLTTLLQIDGRRGTLRDRELRLLSDPVLSGAVAWDLVRRGGFAFNCLWQTVAQAHARSSPASHVFFPLRLLGEIFTCRVLGERTQSAFPPPSDGEAETGLAAAAVVAKLSTSSLSSATGHLVESVANEVLSRASAGNLAVVNKLIPPYLEATHGPFHT